MERAILICPFQDRKEGRVVKGVHYPSSPDGCGATGTLEDILWVQKEGAQKVSIINAAAEKPNFVSGAARISGSKTITVAVDGRRNPAMP